MNIKIYSLRNELNMLLDNRLELTKMQGLSLRLDKLIRQYNSRIYPGHSDNGK